MAGVGPPTVSLWARAELFTYGALPVAPHPRLSLHNIKRIVSYAKTKGKAGFPMLSYSVWKHIACNKLQLPEDLAWMYFVTFDLLRDIPMADRKEWDSKLANCTSPHETDLVKSQMALPTLKFVLFLFIQHLHKISLRASLVSASEEWPLRARSPDLDSGRAASTGSKSLDEHCHMSFLLTNLNEIMELLVEPDSYSGGKGANDLSLSVEAVEALGFLIAGSVDKNRTVLSLHDIALQQQVHQKSGFSKISRSFSFRSLQTWIRSNLGQNPFGIPSCISAGRRLSWPLAGEDREARLEPKRGRIATNALFVPKDQMKGNKLIILSQVCKQTVARSSNTLEWSSVKVHRCHFSFLYLLSPLRSVSIEKCRNSTIVLGAVETAVHLNGCENVTVITACRRISVNGSTSCFLHLLTPNRPVILGSNESIVLAPYHTYYGTLEDHMSQAGLSPTPNLWNSPICVGPDHQEDLPVWELMSPKEFYFFTIPFSIEGPTKAVPGGIPSRYQKALVHRDRQIDMWQKMVKEAGLSRDQRKQFQALVENKFQDWLAETGHRRQLDGLVVPIKPK